MKNLCKNCKFADWREREFYENAECLSDNTSKVKDECGYVIFCSSYLSKNIFKRLWTKLNEN
jgi:hypothetical protein